MIVRDEAACLSACLTSLAPWVDEICVVDTGSTDASIEIAQSFGARIQSLVWNDNFSEARNVSLGMATQSWILVVDADENLREGSGEVLRRLAKSRSSAYLVSQDNLDRHGQVHARMIIRLFRNHRGIEFRRKVHESVSDSLAELGLATELHSGVHLLHEGYLPQMVAARDKRARNERILRRELEAQPDDLYSLHKLGMMLSASDPECCEIYQRAFEVAEAMAPARRAELPYAPRIYANAGAALAGLGKLVQAGQVIERGLTHYAGVAELVFQQADLAQRRGNFALATSLFDSCLKSPEPPAHYPADPNVRGIGAAIGMAKAAIDAGDLAQAVQALQRVQDFDVENPACKTLVLRLLVATRQHDALAQEITALLSTSMALAAELQVLVGDLAWGRGDAGDATAMWRLAQDSVDAGREASCRLTIAALCQDSRDAHPPILLDWDTRAAGCRLCVAVLCGAELDLDASLNRQALRAALVLWLQMLSDAGREDLLVRFSQRAPRFVHQVPGIDELLAAA